MGCMCYAPIGNPTKQKCAHLDSSNTLIECEESMCRSGEGCVKGYSPQGYYGDPMSGILEKRVGSIPMFVILLLLVVFVSLSTISLFIT